jgi:hypothetical protein
MVWIAVLAPFLLNRAAAIDDVSSTYNGEMTAASGEAMCPPRAGRSDVLYRVVAERPSCCTRHLGAMGAQYISPQSAPQFTLGRLGVCFAGHEGEAGLTGLCTVF